MPKIDARSLSGVVAFHYGFDARREVLGAEGIGPAADAHEWGSGIRWVEGVSDRRPWGSRVPTPKGTQ